MRTKHRRSAMTDPGSCNLHTTSLQQSHALCNHTDSIHDHGNTGVLPQVVLLVAATLVPAVLKAVVLVVPAVAPALAAAVLLAVRLRSMVAQQGRNLG